MNFDIEGGDGPGREPEAQAFDGDFAEGKASGIVDKLVENRSIEAQVLGDRVRIYKP